MEQDVYSFLDQIKYEAQTYVSSRLESMTLQQRQGAMTETIRVLDFLFAETIKPNIDPSNREQLVNVFRYAYPVLVKCLYSNFSSEKGIALIASDDNSIINANRLVHACEIIGYINNYKEQLKLGILSVKKQEKDYLHLTFTDKYYWIEFIEDNTILKYAYEVAYTQIEDYEEAFNRLPEILSQMEPLVYVWKDHYIGYTTNPAIDNFFYKNALWDALQAAEWYAFPKDCKFGGIPFEKYVHTVVMLIIMTPGNWTRI